MIAADTSSADTSSADTSSADTSSADTSSADTSAGSLGRPVAGPGREVAEATASPVEVLAILGTGLMGGSLGLASLAGESVPRVVGFDDDPAALSAALARGAITEAAPSAQAAVAEATLVVIATPVRAIPAVFAAIRDHLRPGAIVTDLGSAKGRIVEQIARSVPPGVHFIGGHPLAGSEKDGIGAATGDLFRGAYWILTPTLDTDTGAYGRLVGFLTALGARLISLDPSRHDELVALTSHLPQLLASTLMSFAADLSAMDGGLPLVAAGGFRDMTRIAGSSPELWLDILRENRVAVLATLERFRGALEAMAQMISGERWADLRDSLADARASRALLPVKPGLAAESVIELQVVVHDRPGAVLGVLTTVGEAGINIEYLTVQDSPQGGQGTLHLGLKGEGAAAAALAALDRKGIPARSIPGA